MKIYVRLQDTHRGAWYGKYVRKAESVRLKLFMPNNSHYINFEILTT